MPRDEGRALLFTLEKIERLAHDVDRVRPRSRPRVSLAVAPAIFDRRVGGSFVVGVTRAHVRLARTGRIPQPAPVAADERAQALVARFDHDVLEPISRHAPRLRQFWPWRSPS